MPCYDPPPEVYARESRQENIALRSKLNILTRLACTYCRELERNGRSIPKYAKNWWEAHKEFDATRKR